MSRAEERANLWVVDMRRRICDAVPMKLEDLVRPARTLPSGAAYRKRIAVYLLYQLSHLDREDIAEIVGFESVERVSQAATEIDDRVKSSLAFKLTVDAMLERLVGKWPVANDAARS